MMGSDALWLCDFSQIEVARTGLFAGEPAPTGAGSITGLRLAGPCGSGLAAKRPVLATQEECSLHSQHIKLAHSLLLLLYNTPR